MSIDGRKKSFVIKHVFTDVQNIKNNTIDYGRKETHFNIPWSIYFYPYDSSSKAILRLECDKPCKESDWSVNVTVEAKVLTAAGGVYTVANDHNISPGTSGRTGQLFNSSLILDNYLINGNLTVECHVTINKVTGFEIPMEKYIFRSFNDESAKEISDVALVVKDQKFYVNKMYLVGHSTYFKSLFRGNFNESKQSEVELKDIEPEDFQKFLEVLYGEHVIDGSTVKGILQLADMYDAEMAIRHCETYLINNSTLVLKEKILMAIQYKLEYLKKRCMSEIKNVEDIDSIIPEDSDQFDSKTWKELLKLCVSISKNC